MKKNYLMLFFILFGITASAQNTKTIKSDEHKETSVTSNQKMPLLYSSEKLEVSQEKIIKSGEKFLDVNFTNKTDKTIEVSFVGRFSFYTKEFCEVCIWDEPEYKALYTLTLEPNQTFSSLSLKDLNEKVITPSNLFVTKSFDLSNLKDFKLFVNETNFK